MGSALKKSAPQSQSTGQPNAAGGQAPPPQQMLVQPQQMPVQQGQAQFPVHPVVLAARQQPAAQMTNVQQPVQQPQGFVSAQQPTMVPVVPQQPMMVPQQPMMVAQQPPMMVPQQPPMMVSAAPQQPVQMVPQAQPVYAQQPVQASYAQ